MNNPILSIIVPVYNVSKYLSECLDSILKQPFQNYEIILVDDGSTDCSGDICDEYSHKDSRISVIHKENGGLSSARNKGLDIMRGKYVSFIDSDDFLIDDYYSAAINELETNSEIDYVWLNYIKVINNEVPIDPIPRSKHHCQLLKKDGGDLLKYVVTNEAYAWLKVYRREVFENIRYPEGVVMEDLYIVPQLYERTMACKLMECGFLAYRQTPNSIVHLRHTPKILKDIANAYIQVIELCRKYDKESYIRILASYSSGLLDALVLFPNEDFSDIETKYQNFTYSSKDILKTSISQEQKIKLFLIKILSYRGFLSIYKYIYKIKHHRKNV